MAATKASKYRSLTIKATVSAIRAADNLEHWAKAVDEADRAYWHAMALEAVRDIRAHAVAANQYRPRFVQDVTP